MAAVIKLDVPAARNSGPFIPPVEGTAPRPLVSVLVPTFEPTEHLITALRSVLVQDLGPAQMQITVFDDGTRTSDVEALVAAADSNGRVEIQRAPENEGLALSWNRCIRAARGEVVHLLHQDDWIGDGFYRRMLPAFTKHADVGMSFSRHSLTDAAGNITRVSHLERRRPGILKDWLNVISERQRMQCVSVLVRRSAYERLGGFRPDLCYALDWEMWVRIAASYPVWYEPNMLAYYRRHDGNESSRLLNAGKTYGDTIKCIEIFAEHLPHERREPLLSGAYASFARRTLKYIMRHAIGTREDVGALLEIVNTAVARISRSRFEVWRYRKQIADITERRALQS